MPRKRKDIEASLKKKGFTLETTDHRYYKLYDSDKYTGIYTKISTGSSYKDYSDSLLGKIARQLRLSKSELCDFIDCPMDEKQYRKKVKDREQGS